MTTVFRPIEPGQRRHALSHGQSLVVDVLRLSPFGRGKWLCLTRPGGEAVFIAEAEFGDVVSAPAPKSTESGGRQKTHVMPRSIRALSPAAVVAAFDKRS